MSYESQSPEVYQYGSHPYSSFSQSPLTSFQVNPVLATPLSSFSYQPPPQAYISNNPSPNINSNPIQSNFTFHPNNYPINPPLQPNSRPFNSQLSAQQNNKPQIQIDNRLVQGPIQNKSIEEEPNDDRYEHYLDEGREYKYNIFSALDEPWNRCLKGQGCGTLPGNECIARSNHKKYWY